MIDSSSFDAINRNRLAPVLEPHGYKNIGSDGFRTRFESPEFFVDVLYDATRSHEISIVLGPLNAVEALSLELSDALRANGSPEDDVRLVASIQASDDDVLSGIMARVAEVLRRSARVFLERRIEPYEEAVRLRSERAATYTSKVMHQPVLEAAETSWAAKDYGRVHDLLNPIRDSLDETHLRRLELAAKRLD